MAERDETERDAQGVAHWDEEGGRLVVDLDGYEGPLDVLLGLARDQKVDLARISILELVDQYIAFVERARTLRLELAADYLVMAAWLAYLKSRLLLPEPEEEGEPSAEELAEELSFRLRRLEAMREAGGRLMRRPLLGRDVFPRGAPEGVRVIRHNLFDLSYVDLLRAYADHKRRTSGGELRITPVRLHTMEQALRRIQGMLGGIRDWTALASFLPPGLLGGELLCRSALAASFAASLELARQGRVEIRQSRPFAPLYLRTREGEE